MSEAIAKVSVKSSKQFICCIGAVSRVVDEGTAILIGALVAAVGIAVPVFHYRADRKRKEREAEALAQAKEQEQAHRRARHDALRAVLATDAIAQVKAAFYMASALALWWSGKLPLQLRLARLICPSTLVWDAHADEFRKNEPAPAALADVVKFYGNLTQILSMFEEMEKQGPDANGPTGLPSGGRTAGLVLLGKLLIVEGAAKGIVQKIGTDVHVRRLRKVSSQGAETAKLVGQLLAAESPVNSPTGPERSPSNPSLA